MKIVIDVYIDFNGTAVHADTIVDSTSISMQVGWDPNGIETYRNDKLNIKLWPNPFSDEILLSLPDNNNSSVTVELFSMLGEKLISKEFKARQNGDHYRISCPHLPNGTYLIRVNSGNKHASKILHKTL